MCVCICNHLLTKVFIGKIEVIGYEMSVDDHGQTNQLHDINWGVLDHASCAPQFLLCNYCVCVSVCLSVGVPSCTSEVKHHMVLCKLYYLADLLKIVMFCLGSMV